MPTWDKSIPAGHETDATQCPVELFAPIPFSRVSVAILNVALAWLDPYEVEEGLEALPPGLSGAEVDELAAARAVKGPV